jgi:hypothetical protein
VTAHVRRSIEHRINLGDYESVTFSSAVETDCEEGQEEQALDNLSLVLVDAMSDHIRKAKRLAPSESYIHDWKD